LKEVSAKDENGLDSIIAAGRHRSMTSRLGGTCGPLTLSIRWRLLGLSRWIEWVSGAANEWEGNRTGNEGGI